MDKSIEEIVKNLKHPHELNRALVNLSLEVARQFYKRAMELIDEALYRLKGKELKVEHRRERWVSSPLGDVRIRRRQYADREGKNCCLLDELMGLQGKSPLTGELKEAALFVTTLLPFLKSTQVLERSLPQASVSHATLHRLVKKTVEPVRQAGETNRKRLYEWGEIPTDGEASVPRLWIEADGVNIALQREKASKAEVKVGIAYEGWQEVSKGRYKLVGKTAYCALESGQSFWEGFALKLAGKYDLARIGEKVIGGDGASWVRGGVELFGGIFQLDRFHLLRALRQSLSRQPGMVNPVYLACNEGNWPLAESLLKMARGKAEGEDRRKVEQVTRYLKENIEGLKDYRLGVAGGGKGLRRTGAIESNVDKLVANRMKKRGMSWTLEGARSMVCLLRLSFEGGLSAACRPKTKDQKGRPPVSKMRRILVKAFKDEEEKWLEASVPALYGPHTNRPWVQALKRLVEVSPNV